MNETIVGITRGNKDGALQIVVKKCFARHITQRIAIETDATSRRTTAALHSLESIVADIADVGREVGVSVSDKLRVFKRVFAHTHDGVGNTIIGNGVDV